MINRVILVGRLTKDPETKETKTGIMKTTFTMAINRTFTNAKGEREADFINVVTFRNQAKNVSNYLSKGQLAGVDGRIQSRSFENEEGRRIFITEVVADNVQFLESKNKSEKEKSTYQNNEKSYTNSYQSQNNRQKNFNQPINNNPFNNAPIDIDDDDLPF